MNAQERLKRKRRKRLYRRLQLLVPIAVVVLLIAGLTAGGIILSLNQTKKHTQDSSQVAEGNESRSGSEDDPDGTSDEGGDGSESMTEEPTEEETLPPSDEERFEALVRELRDRLSAVPSGEETPEEEPGSEAGTEGETGTEAGDADARLLLTAADPQLPEIRKRLEELDPSGFNAGNRDLYDVLLDTVKVGSDGAGYVSGAPAPGQVLLGVEGGTDYYTYLLRSLSGSSEGVQAVHDALANELNGNNESVKALLSADPMLSQNASGLNKSAPNSDYLFDTVTAASDPLLVKTATRGLTNGWQEFGLIRAYQMDDSLSEELKNYLIGSTRMTYAMYGVLDISVHYSGWNLDQVTELCVNYFGGDQSAFASGMYQLILDNPGVYAAAAYSYLQLVDVETTLRENTADYGEQVLLDFLFGRGPAPFRVYWSWLGK